MIGFKSLQMALPKAAVPYHLWDTGIDPREEKEVGSTLATLYLQWY